MARGYGSSRSDLEPSTAVVSGSGSGSAMGSVAVVSNDARVQSPGPTLVPKSGSWLLAPGCCQTPVEKRGRPPVVP
jgi:hypothetical protein